MPAEWMSTHQAAAALGVKPTSLYAYVSRGVISREVVVHDGRRESRFRRGDVLALAAARTRPRAGVVSSLVESEVSTLDAEGRLAFRGVDVAECSAWGFERTARHVLGCPDVAWPRVPAPSSRPASHAPTGDVLRQVVLDGAGADPERDAISVGHCVHVALSAVEHGVVAVTGERDGTVAQRLAARWSVPGRDPEHVARLTEALDVALCVLVDHELTASTVAGRAAAGGQADPWMVLLAGLAALSGPLHGRASTAALHAVRSWARGESPADGPVGGFGHAVYVGPDPRAELLLAQVQRLCPAVHDQVEGLAIHVARREGRHPNVDLGLAALIEAADLPDEAGETLFTLARIPGLMAHALEEYPHQLRFRLRAVT